MDITIFEELLEKKDYEAIITLFEEQHPAESAELISVVEPTVIWKLLLKLNSKVRAEIFSHIHLETQILIAERLSRRSLSQIFTDMPPDDRADLFKKLSKEIQDLLIPALAQAEREDILKLSSYEEKTAGSVMTSEYVALFEKNTVTEAIEKIRKEAPDTETIYYAYIVDQDRKLKGFVSLRGLLLAKPKLKLEDIMQQDLATCLVTEDQEDAARRLQKYDLIAIPVVDEHNVLVGIITHDDALDVITQEQTEDFEKLMAISGSHESGAYLKKTAWTHFKDRSVWIVVLAIVGLVPGMIIHHFEDALLHLMLLALYMPMMANTGGNSGNQAATVIVRALSLKEVSTKDVFKILFKELSISLMLASVLALLIGTKILFFTSGMTIPGNLTLLRIALAVSFGLGLQVITATMIGSMLPLLASKLKLDPAVIANPVLTTVVDITGLLLYFNIARLFLGI
ncbi:MAG: magnesium transporter [Candidatus Margulisbacteria bacterium]|nr:magnesium transporter [Candidatus Margulisiibacteriota bacterium]